MNSLGIKSHVRQVFKFIIQTCCRVDSKEFSFHVQTVGNINRRQIKDELVGEAVSDVDSCFRDSLTRYLRHVHRCGVQTCSNLKTFLTNIYGFDFH